MIAVLNAFVKFAPPKYFRCWAVAKVTNDFAKVAGETPVRFDS